VVSFKEEKRMRVSVFVGILATLFAIAWNSAEPNAPVPPASSIERTVEARSRAWAKAAVDRDIPAFRSFASDDYVLMWVEPTANGQKAKWATWTRDEWAKQLQSGHLKYHSVEMRNTKVFLHGDVAVFSGEYTEKGTRDGSDYTDGGLFTETWVNRHGQWIVVASTFP
jgi:ketosteroid isomerase-like protein